jgi:hypothetical protein
MHAGSSPYCAQYLNFFSIQRVKVMAVIQITWAIAVFTPPPPPKKKKTKNKKKIKKK